jgi:uncharacterized protein YciI
LSTFIYLLKLVPRLQHAANWQPEDDQAVDLHFAYLQQLLKDGNLVLAGRTQEMNENTFGIVIFECECEEDAQKIMNSDPAVQKGIMVASLYPYRIALSRLAA